MTSSEGCTTCTEQQQRDDAASVTTLVADGGDECYGCSISNRSIIRQEALQEQTSPTHINRITGASALPSWLPKPRLPATARAAGLLPPTMPTARLQRKEIRQRSSSFYFKLTSHSEDWVDDISDDEEESEELYGLSLCDLK